mgnify:CR=1 FL=1
MQWRHGLDPNGREDRDSIPTRRSRATGPSWRCSPIRRRRAHRSGDHPARRRLRGLGAARHGALRARLRRTAGSSSEFSSSSATIRSPDQRPTCCRPAPTSCAAAGASGHPADDPNQAFIEPDQLSYPLRVRAHRPALRQPVRARHRHQSEVLRLRPPSQANTARSTSSSRARRSRSPARESGRDSTTMRRATSTSRRRSATSSASRSSTAATGAAAPPASAASRPTSTCSGRTAASSTRSSAATRAPNAPTW